MITKAAIGTPTATPVTRVTTIEPEPLSHGHGQPPGSQSFWVAQASGTHPILTWTVTSGSYRVVVMNTDASAPVAFAGGLDLTIPHSFAIGVGMLIGG
jgi:hypothetical protein